MAKAAKLKTAAKPKNKREQYERFEKAARDLGADDEASAKEFERVFGKIVPPRRAPKEFPRDRG
jgi:hypothetical protein